MWELQSWGFEAEGFRSRRAIRVLGFLGFLGFLVFRVLGLRVLGFKGKGLRFWG